MILHLLTIQDNNTDDTTFHGFDRPALRAQVAAYCRENWPHEMTHNNAEPMPEDEDEIIDAYFLDHHREFLIEQEFPLPQPFASAPTLLAGCEFALSSILDAEEMEEIEEDAFSETKRTLRQAIATATV